MKVFYAKGLLLWISFWMAEAQMYWRPHENHRVPYAIPQKPYPLNGNLPLSNFQVYHRNNNQMYQNGGQQLADDSWIVNAINGYNVPVTTQETTTELPETTSSAPETTTNYYKNPKLYDDYEDLITIAPANALIIILCNIVAIVMIFMGSPIAWEGRRSIDDDHQDVMNDILSIKLLNDGLQFGSSSSSNNWCLQRVACEVPRHANTYAKAFHLLAWMTNIVPFIPDNSDHLEEIADELKRSAALADDGSNCNLKFPCNSVPDLKSSSYLKSKLIENL